MSKRILLVEDSKSISEPLSFLLRREGYEVALAETGDEALKVFRASPPDAILLDLMLPGVSGLDVCRAVRETSEVPIIMVTAKDSEMDVVLGLELGADDYVAKPYKTAELLARLRAVLRRKQAPVSDVDEPIRVGNIVIDVDSHTLEVDSQPVYMPLREFELLTFLAQNVDRVLTRSQLLDRVWGTDYYGDSKTLDVHIKRIRAKIEAHPERPERLVTVRGLGYKLTS